LKENRRKAMNAELEIEDERRRKRRNITKVL
jgi:hypothetical protein